MRASPDSLSRTRLKAGAEAATAENLLFAHHETREAGDADVLAGLRRNLCPQLLEGLAVVAVGAHMLLLEERDLLAPLRQLSLDDLLDDVVGLALFAGLGLEDTALGVGLRIGDLVGRDDEWRRRRPGDVDRDLLRELPELVGTRHEVGLTLDLDHHPDLPGRVDVGRHNP